MYALNLHVHQTNVVFAVNSQCGEFWLYRWLELLDASSQYTFRVEVFATSQASRRHTDLVWST